MLELQLNLNLQRPFIEREVFVPDLGIVTLASNGDLGSDVVILRSVRSLLDSDKKFVDTPGVGGGVHQVPEQDLVFRQQQTWGDVSALKEDVRTHAREVNILRGLGIAVVPHASVVVSTADMHLPESADVSPHIITFAQKIPGQDRPNNNLDPGDPKNASMVTHITSRLQQYYTHDIERPHIMDISRSSQYSSGGALLDLEMITTETVGPDLKRWYDTCGEQLRTMYESFDLSASQIAELKKNHSTSLRPRIEIRRSDVHPEQPTNNPIGQTTLKAIYAKFEEVEGIIRQAQRLAEEAADFTQDARDLITKAGEEKVTEQDVTTEILQQWNAAQVGAENLTEIFNVAVERMWKSFPKI